jgi:hypothetical protein
VASLVPVAPFGWREVRTLEGLRRGLAHGPVRVVLGRPFERFPGATVAGENVGDDRHDLVDTELASPARLAGDRVKSGVAHSVHRVLKRLGEHGGRDIVRVVVQEKQKVSTYRRARVVERHVSAVKPSDTDAPVMSTS